MPFAIQEKGANSRIMYYMIHVSDHRPRSRTDVAGVSNSPREAAD